MEQNTQIKEPKFGDKFLHHFYINDQLKESDKVIFNGVSKNGRWYKFKSIKDEKSSQMVEKKCFPLHEWYMEKTIKATSKFTPIQ
jgi:hypothetical protein